VFLRDSLELKKYPEFQDCIPTELNDLAKMFKQDVVMPYLGGIATGQLAARGLITKILSPDTN